MKTISFVRLSLLVLLLMIPARALSTNIKTFESAHPHYVTKDALSKTSNFRAATDGNDVKIQLCVRDEAMQARLLHGGLVIKIDPAGGKNAQVLIKFPSIFDGDTPPSPRMNGAQSGRKTRLSNMVDNLAERPVWLIAGCDTVMLEPGSVAVGIDDCGFLTYTAVVPVNAITNDVSTTKKWNFGIYSEAINEDMPPQPKNEGVPAEGRERRGPEGMPPGGPGGGMPPGGMGGGPGMGGGRPGMGGPRPSSGARDANISKDKIEQWIKISYTDMNK